MVPSSSLARLRLALVSLSVACGLVAASPRASADDFTLSVTASGRHHADEGAQWRVLLGLAIPIDDLVFGTPPSSLASPIAEPPETEPSGAPSLPSVEPAPSADEAGLVDRAPPSPEPTVSVGLARRVVRAALRVRGRGTGLRRLDDLSSRANRSAWLPQLRLSVGRSTDETLRLNPTIDDPYRYTQSGGSDLWGEVRLTWDLDRIVFAPEEIAVERIRDRRVAERVRVISEVLEILFVWHRARIEAADEWVPPKARAAARFRELEARLTLDVMTDGWFSEHVDGAEGAAKEAPAVRP